MVTILMMSVKIATLGLLKIKGILKNKLRRRNSVYDVSTKFYHVTQLYCTFIHVTRVW